MRQTSLRPTAGMKRIMPETPAKIRRKAAMGRMHRAAFRASSGAGMSIRRTPGPDVGGMTSSPIPAHATKSMRTEKQKSPPEKRPRGIGADRRRAIGLEGPLHQSLEDFPAPILNGRDPGLSLFGAAGANMLTRNSIAARCESGP